MSEAIDNTPKDESQIVDIGAVVERGLGISAHNREKRARDLMDSQYRFVPSDDVQEVLSGLTAELHDLRCDFAELATEAATILSQVDSVSARELAKKFERFAKENPSSIA